MLYYDIFHMIISYIIYIYIYMYRERDTIYTYMYICICIYIYIYIHYHSMLRVKRWARVHDRVRGRAPGTGYDQSTC